MKPTKTSDEEVNPQESMYALLMRSEEKSRNLLEVIIYQLLIVGAMIAISQFLTQPVNIPNQPAFTAVRGELMFNASQNFAKPPGRFPRYFAARAPRIS